MYSYRSLEARVRADHPLRAIQAMAAQKVIIGRVWPAWPTKVRVTVGTQAEMDKFTAAVATIVG